LGNPTGRTKVLNFPTAGLTRGKPWNYSETGVPPPEEIKNQKSGGRPARSPGKENARGVLKESQFTFVVGG